MNRYCVMDGSHRDTWVRVELSSHPGELWIPDTESFTTRTALEQ